MLVDDEAIGLVRAHRWASVSAQTRRLKEAGCVKVFDLANYARADMERIAGRRTVKLVYAFLLASPDKTRGMWSDFLAALGRIDARKGVVVDVDSGLHSEGNRAAFLDVVAGQVRRHNQGEKAHTRKGKPGRQLVVFTRGQLRQARAVWKDVANFATYEAAERELAKIKTAKGEKFSVSRAFRLWKGRPAKQPD
jgi:hypothetical protein